MKKLLVRASICLFASLMLIAGCSGPAPGSDGWDVGVDADSGGSAEVGKKDGGDADVDQDGGDAGEQPQWQTVDVPESSTTKFDLLWVIDNSSSMCEKQQQLREDFPSFVQMMTEKPVDFHVAVTTTHFNESFPFEKVARGGHLQSTPHPPVGPNPACRTGDGDSEYPGEFAPTKRQIEQAVRCTAGYTDDPDGFPDELRDVYNPTTDRVAWSDDALKCALQGEQNACDAVGKDPANFGVEHLFPCGHLKGESCDRSDFQDVYRDIPKVLRASDYRNGDGSLDRDAMARDFACMSFVGTRGGGQEQGLRAAVEALSPRMTGGPVGDPIQDPSTVQDDGEDWSYPNGDPTQAPNHGFLREEAETGVVFFSDENDCSRPDDVNLVDRYRCGEMNCYFAAKETRNGDGPLFGTGEMAEKFRQNLADSKRLDGVGSEDVVVATIDGGYQPYDGEVVQNCENSNDRFESIRMCNTSLGAAWTGDRYQDFAANFERRAPGEVGSSESPGRMCQLEGISPTLSEVAAEIDASAGCPSIAIPSCEGPDDQMSCPRYEYGSEAGPPRCREWGGVLEGSYCESAVQVRLTYTGDGDAGAELASTGLCYEQSIGEVGEDATGCVVRREAYQWATCSEGDQSSMEPVWKTSQVPNPARQLAEFDVRAAYRSN